MITVLSLFDGISCGQLALERANINYLYFASEIDKYAIQITQTNYANIHQLGCITKIKGKDLPQIDLLIGGSPCQGFSFAGNQLNFKDPRSILFFEFVRILDECKPKYFLLENVKMKKEYQEVITSFLGVEPIEINSALVSAQNRKRLYWFNWNIRNLKDKELLLKDILENGVPLRDKSQTILATIYKENAKSMVKRKKKGLLVKLDGDSVRKLSVLECERLQTLPDNYTKGISKTQRYRCIGNCWTVDVIVHLFKELKITILLS